MKVTPVNKKFGKYKPGDVFDFPDKPAKVFIKIGKLEQVQSAPTYKTRMMTAAGPFVGGLPSPETIAAQPRGTLTTSEAPYGYKADGTPRKRPGRMKASE